MATDFPQGFQVTTVSADGTTSRLTFSNPSHGKTRVAIDVVDKDSRRVGMQIFDLDRRMVHKLSDFLLLALK